MKVAGLFVGVGKFADPGIEELLFAQNDAIALHAFFADGNLAEGCADSMCRLLANDRATAEGFLSALNATIEDANCGNADLVVVHLSCHGTPSGTLVMHDTERTSPDATGVPVHLLISQLSTVRSCPVILTLDCCFAGTALGLTESPNRAAFNELMHGFEDQSRIVGCAAEFGQKAYEDREYGKGLFSHALWSRLQEAVNNSEKELSGFDWIRDAVQRTSGLAQTRGRAQSATAFVTVRNAEMRLKVASDRPHQLKLVVPADLPPLTDAIESLSGHGLDAAAIAAIKQRLGPGGKLNALQKQAVVEGGILRHQSVFVRAPTSAGKTLIAELAVLGHQQSGRKSVVLLPLRALAREHARTFEMAYSNLGLRTIVSTGDAHDSDDLLLRGQFDVAFLTFEKFSAVISAKPDLRDSLGLIVFDELQTISDDGRGHTLELLLVQVRRWHNDSRWPQIVALCGELADLASLQQWLNLPVISSGVRPVPLHEGVLRTATGNVRFYQRDTLAERSESWPAARAHLTANDERERRREAATPVIRQLVSEGMQVLVFCSEKPQARRMAERLAKMCDLPPSARLVTELESLDASTDHRTRALLREIAKKGVGLHVADLNDGERSAVEDAFRRKDLPILVATSTLSQGVNLPADAVVFVDDVRYDGTTNVPIAAVDYRNIAGRAGRLIPGGPPRGIAILVATSESRQHQMWQNYIVAPFDSLTSSLGDLATEDLVLLLLRQFDTATVNDLTGALADTYWATTERTDSRWRRSRRADIEAALEKLQQVHLVVRATETEWQLSPVGRVASGYGLSWVSAKRVHEGIQRLVRTNDVFDTLALTAVALATEELRLCRCPNGTTPVPASPPASLKARVGLWSVLTSQDNEEGAGDRLHKLGAINRWLGGSSLTDVESHFARTANDNVVAGMFFNLLNRLTAILPAVGAIAAIESPEKAQELRDTVSRLRLQLSIGGGRDAAALHRLRLGLTRGQCLGLVGLEIRDLAGLRHAVRERPSDLEQLLSTQGLHRLQALLADRRHQARISAPEPMLSFEGFA